MADWRKLSKSLALGDGRIDEKETEIMRKELFADRKIDREEIEFLLDLKKSAKSAVRAFHQLVNDGLVNVILASGHVTIDETKWLRKWIFADKNVDEWERQLIQTLKNKARSTCKEFEDLVAEVGG